MQARETVPIVADVVATQIGSLLLATAPIDPSMCVLDVAPLFLESRHAGLLSLPIVSADARPLGLISRYELMRIFLMPYGRELFGRRPVTSVMNAKPLMLMATTPIDEAARAVATNITSPITEDFILVDESGRYAGTGLVLDVLRAVESRLSQHGDELERAYARVKSSQLQLVQSEKMASLGQMVAGLVHEINTPLGYVRNNVEMTRATLGDAAHLVAAQEAVIAALTGTEEPAAELDLRLAEIEELRPRVDGAALDDLCALLDDTVHGIGQISELVVNLKDFSRLDQAGLQKADLNTLVESALRIVQHIVRKRGIEVTHEAGAIPPIDCSPAQINQVLLNLISNAAQAIEHAEGKIVVRTQALDRRVLVLVEDNGKGIAAPDLPRIFDPFFTTKPVGQGSGMGLAISHQIIEQHGGVIQVRSKVGVGTRFLIVLPVLGAMA